MRGALVMTMAMISPSGREVSLAEQLHESPRLVRPRFRLVVAEFRPRRWLMIFFPSKDSIQQKMATGGPPGGPRGRGRTQGGRACPPPSWAGCAPPWWSSCSQYFLYIPKRAFMKFQGFWSCAELVSNICSFSSPEFQLPAFPLFM